MHASSRTERNAEKMVSTEIPADPPTVFNDSGGSSESSDFLPQIRQDPLWAGSLFQRGFSLSGNCPFIRIDVRASFRQRIPIECITCGNVKSQVQEVLYPDSQKNPAGMPGNSYMVFHHSGYFFSSRTTRSQGSRKVSDEIQAEKRFSTS